MKFTKIFLIARLHVALNELSEKFWFGINDEANFTSSWGVCWEWGVGKNHGEWERIGGSGKNHGELERIGEGMGEYREFGRAWMVR